MAQSPEATGPGLFLVGEYVGLRDQRPRVKVYNDVETTYQGCDVGLRIDGDLESIGFPDRASAEAFVAGWTAGEEHAIKVRPLHGVNTNGPWLLWNAAAVAAPASSFAVPARG